MENILTFVHMVSLCIWLGSMVTWAVFAPKLYKIDPTKNTTNTLRGSFTKISWGSFWVAFVTNSLIQLTTDSSSNWMNELIFLSIAAGIIALHSFLGNKLSAAVRGMLNGVMLIIALVVVYLATNYI